jgi:photosystem II stability/assembly factor-like uncharacterized protein
MKNFLHTLFFFLLVTQICFPQWYLQTPNPPQSVSLWAVSFTDSNHGTAVGDFGIIFHTTNGGINWTTQQSGINTWLGRVSFCDSTYGTIVGDFGKILRTTNGGAEWVSKVSGTTVSLE